MKRILVIDNYDSFTYNLVQYLGEIGAEPIIWRNDQFELEDIAALNPDGIVISPGPATPDEAGLTVAVIKHYGDKYPIFGVCLGHQSIAQAFGGEVIRAKNMMHGKTSQVEIEKETVIYKGLPKEFRATRYHSLTVNQENLPSHIIATSYSKDDHEIMSLEIEGKKVYGVQFHPESIMSEHGYEMLDNFLKL